MRLMLSLIVIFGLTQWGCSRKVSLPEIKDITKIVVKDVHGNFVKEIEGRTQVSQLLQLVNAQRSDWESVWRNAPATMLFLEFFDGAEYKGRFDLCLEYCKIQQDKTTYVRRITLAENSAFLKTIGVKLSIDTR